MPILHWQKNVTRHNKWDKTVEVEKVVQAEKASSSQLHYNLTGKSCCLVHLEKMGKYIHKEECKSCDLCQIRVSYSRGVKVFSIFLR